METGLRWGFWYNEQLEIVELPWSSKPTCAESVVFWFPGGQVYKKQIKSPNVGKGTNQNKCKLLKQLLVEWINVLH